jgi:beta-1,4-mannosyltransferase
MKGGRIFFILKMCLIISVVLGGVLVALYGWRRSITRSFPYEKPLIQVIVLGDIGHSPRMQYHALSAASTGQYRVQLIGFPGSAPISLVSENPDIWITHLKRFQINERYKVPFIIYAILKVLFESLQLFAILVTSDHADFTLMQSPPAVPSMFVCVFVSLIRGTKLLIDFHNITYLHLKFKLNSNNLIHSRIINAVRIYESTLSRFAFHSFCVTNSMKQFLETEFRLKKISTLYDHPGPQFTGRTSSEVRADLSRRLCQNGTIPIELDKFDFFLISSTSWTPDENFNMILESLPIIESRVPTGERVLLFITGKGEMKNEFIEKFNKLNLKKITLGTGWLAAADYPLLIGAADLGISVHVSTSGLDLPMKVVDMFGCGTPVAALDFPALKELVSDGNGWVFQDSVGLANIVIDCMGNRNNRKINCNNSSFENEWNKIIFPIIRQKN